MFSGREGSSCSTSATRSYLLSPLFHFQSVNRLTPPAYMCKADPSSSRFCGTKILFNVLNVYFSFLAQQYSCIPCTRYICYREFYSVFRLYLAMFKADLISIVRYNANQMTHGIKSKTRQTGNIVNYKKTSDNFHKAKTEMRSCPLKGSICPAHCMTFVMYNDNTNTQF